MRIDPRTTVAVRVVVEESSSDDAMDYAVRLVARMAEAGWVAPWSAAYAGGHPVSGVRVYGTTPPVAYVTARAIPATEADTATAPRVAAAIARLGCSAPEAWLVSVVLDWVGLAWELSTLYRSEAAVVIGAAVSSGLSHPVGDDLTSYSPAAVRAHLEAVGQAERTVQVLGPMREDLESLAAVPVGARELILGVAEGVGSAASAVGELASTLGGLVGAGLTVAASWWLLRRGRARR